MRWLSTGIVLMVCLAAAALSPGCGSGSASKAPLKGKVMANGQPVTGGRLTFAPASELQGAVPITVQIQSDGTFVASTDRPGDGIAIGKHQVAFTAPDAQITETTDGSDPIVKLSPFVGLLVQQTDVEVKPGENEIVVELIGGSAGGS